MLELMEKMDVGSIAGKEKERREKLAKFLPFFI